MGKKTVSGHGKVYSILFHKMAKINIPNLQIYKLINSDVSE